MKTRERISREEVLEASSQITDARLSLSMADYHLDNLEHQIIQCSGTDLSKQTLRHLARMRKRIMRARRLAKVVKRDLKVMSNLWNAIYDLTADKK